MIDGLGMPELAALDAAMQRTIDRRVLPACGVAIGKPLAGTPRLGKLEPDLIGEFFVLEVLRNDPANPFVEKPIWMPKLGWQTNGRAMFDLIQRAKQTFGSHEAMRRLEIIVEGVRESWWQAALVRFFRAGSPDKRFNSAQALLRPHVQSDMGAAAAFANLVEFAAAKEFVVIMFPELIEASRALQSIQQVHATHAALCEQVARALFSIATRLSRFGARQSAIAIYDDLIAHLGTASDPVMVELVACSLFNKGVALSVLGRRKEAITTYDEVLARFGGVSEPTLREQVAKALNNKGNELSALGRREDAIALYDDLIVRFGAATEFPLRKPVAIALVNKGNALGELGRSEQAIASYSEMITRFDTASELPLRTLVAEALANKGSILSMLTKQSVI
jgi:tetratricopeptide (TPR) repeat protein